MLLVNGRGNDQLAMHVADDAASQHVRFAVRIEVVECIDRIADAEDGDLATLEPGGHACFGNDVVEFTHELPGRRGLHTASFWRSSRSSRVAGRICPRSSMNTTLSSAR